MNVLVACEESQRVAMAFRKLGHNAFSCDIRKPSGGHPEFHIQDDVLKHLDGWDLIIGFPPCTFLSTTGNRWFKEEFFLAIANAPCKHIAIENPVGIMSSKFRKPDQIIQPYMFGARFEKRTCLWLKNLPKLKPTKVVEPPKRIVFESGKSMPAWYADAWNFKKEERAKMRSKTFLGVAEAMATQWGGYIERKQILLKALESEV